MHTKGEWLITRDTKRDYIAVRSVDDSPVCFIHSIIPNAEANAHLIAGAPILYEACKAVDEYLNAGFPNNLKLKKIMFELVEKAIAKVEDNA